MHLFRSTLATVAALAALAQLSQALPTTTSFDVAGNSSSSGSSSGTSSRQHDTRAEAIVGGHPPLPGEAAFTAILTNDYHTKYCSAVLISPTKLLTAAHCVYGDIPANKHSVRIGSTHRNDGGELIRLRGFFVHPDYDPLGEGVNDLAILTLERVVPSQVAAPAILPSRNFSPTVCQSVTVAGWGRHFREDPVKEELGEAEVEVLDPLFCENRYGDWKFRESTHLCLGVLPDGGKGACKGDSGGPAFIERGTVIGISSFGGEVCSSATEHSVYTRVDRYLDFIQADM